MKVSSWTDRDTERAIQIWSEYQQKYDVSDRKGQTAGIDPNSGRIWFGESIVDIGRQLDAEGLDTPLYFVRVGSDYYFRKGGRR
jgi:hypothetical protein